MSLPGQFDHPKFLNIMEKIRLVAADLGVPGGEHIVEPDPQELHKSIRAGNRFIAYGLDTRMLDSTARRGLEYVRELRS